VNRGGGAKSIAKNIFREIVLGMQKGGVGGAFDGGDSGRGVWGAVFPGALEAKSRKSMIQSTKKKQKDEQCKMGKTLQCALTRGEGGPPC